LHRSEESADHLVALLDKGLGMPVILMDREGRVLASSRKGNAGVSRSLADLRERLTGYEGAFPTWIDLSFHVAGVFEWVGEDCGEGFLVLLPEGLGHYESASDLQGLCDVMFNEVLISGPDGRCLGVNAACQRLYGLEVTDVIGKSLQELEALGCFSASVARISLRTKRRVTLSQVVRGRHLVATASPMFTRNGDLGRIVTNTHDVTELTTLRQRLAETRSLVERHWSEIVTLREEIVHVGSMVYRSESMARIVDLVKKVSIADSTVLITGETGTGKDLLAKLVHRMSNRSKGPFITVNCGAIPENLLESELFGYEKGAFTSAKEQGKLGLVQMADGGTLFLNEVGDLPYNLQVKVLHLIQDREFTKVGGNRPVRVNVRIIAATNRDLPGMISQERFREDLYYRLNVIPVYIPPLRERPEDIVALAEHFVQHYSKKLDKPRAFSPGTLEILTNYDWPGNVRQLENVIERLVVTTEGDLIKETDLPSEFYRSSQPSRGEKPGSGLKGILRAVEYRLISQALEQHGSTRRAAKALGISQPTLVRKMQKHGLKSNFALDEDQ